MSDEANVPGLASDMRKLAADVDGRHRKWAKGCVKSKTTGGPT